MHEARRTEPPARGGGIPDGLLVALLAFLLGLAVLVWTATGLSALFSHGTWPDTVTFTRTPTAVRALITEPHDIPAAWPDTPAPALPGWGLFWGLFIGQLLTLFVLTIFTINAVARTKSRRALQKAGLLPPTPAPPTPIPAPPISAPPALEARGPGGRAPATTPHPATLPAAPNPAPPTPAPPALEAQGPGGRAPATTPHPATIPAPPPAPPAFEARELGGSAPATAQHPATLPAPPLPASPALEARGLGGSTPATTPHPATHPAPSAITPRAAGPKTPTALTYATPTTRLHTATHHLTPTQTPGPALIITSSPTLYAETRAARAKLGPVLLYDPSHLCEDTPRLHWNPTEGCTDRTTAATRATALLAPVRPQARMDAPVADTAETLLRSWLQAAALDDRPFKHLHRWAQGNSAQDPVRILRTHPQATAGAAGELESALTAHPERRELAQHLTARALACLTSVHIREACTPNRTDSLTLASFLAEGGSLYVVGEPLEDPRTHPGAMPLLTALASHVVEHGRRMAARSSHGRLDPPLSLVLEDVAAVAPFPQLPDVLAENVLPVLALCRSREQARSRWPEAGF
ncbi:type VI secretion protein [Streptomyces sp. NPDC047014]|uniref:type VI secretion protein n=1 Tax=Streptomyces sp. NPDC047014 TaxID=3155736 RepID=UPI0033C86D2D